MRRDCIDIEDIPGVLDLPEGDPARVHVEDCPRCSALLVSYIAFIEAEKTAGADPADARERLSEYLGTLSGNTVPEQAGKEEASFTKRLRGFFAPAVTRRPAWAAALLVVAIASVLWWRPWKSEPIVLRGPGVEEEAPALSLHPPVAGPEGSVRLEWTAMPGADSYEVRLYDRSLEEIARLPRVAETSIVLDRSLLPDDAPSVLVWRVLAYEGGDQTSSSDPAFLELGRAAERQGVSR